MASRSISKCVQNLQILFIVTFCPSVLAPSGTVFVKPYGHRKKYKNQNFVDLEYSIPTYPYKLAVYETFNPGSVVAVWALVEQKTEQAKWEKLWGGSYEKV